ncbi:MAG: succinate dehydrogenase assembly factor 2 [Steroidobacteraceae bacterium]
MNAAAQPPGRLRWRCRRGMKELDVLLERWLARDWAAAPSDERAAFDRLLDLQDPELARYLLAGAIPADTATARLVARIREP